MGAAVQRISADGRELRVLASRLAGAGSGGRILLGIAGEPGAGKSHLAAALARHLGSRAAVVPGDAFHLADAELCRQGLLDRKGAPETFDVSGYAALLGRLRQRIDPVVYAPQFERELEQPLAGAIAVRAQVEVVMTEANYLLVDGQGWSSVRAQLDEVWLVETERSRRLDRLRDRHVLFGKTAAAAAEWVSRVDEPNARLVRESRAEADRVLDLSGWSGRIQPQT